jgi:hypothetical protein
LFFIDKPPCFARQREASFASKNPKKTSKACFPFANKNFVFITKQGKVLRTLALKDKVVSKKPYNKFVFVSKGKFVAKFFIDKPLKKRAWLIFQLLIF